MCPIMARASWVGKKTRRKIGFQLDIINPEDPAGLRVTVTIPCDLIQKWYKFSYVDYQNLETAKFVLGHPIRIFRGIRQYEEGGYCYVGKPATWYIRRDCLVSFPRDKVFTVYLNPNFWLYELRAERAADDDPFSPEDWKNRYEVLLWKSDIS